jgi:hypothetical protein
MSPELNFFAEGPTEPGEESEKPPVGQPVGNSIGATSGRAGNDLRFTRKTRYPLSLPPFLVPGYLASLGLFRTPVIVVAWGVPLLAAALAWARLVFRRD